MWFKFVKFITSVLVLEKFWNNYSMFRTMCRPLCKNLSFRTIVVWSVEIYLLLNMVCFEYFLCIHALLFLSKIFTASCWLDVPPCINFVEPETVPSIFWVNDFLCLDTLLLFSENFAVHSRVSDLLDVSLQHQIMSIASVINFVNVFMFLV